MLTKKMYEEMMVQRHGDWADFFMDNSLEHDEAHDGAPTTGAPSLKQQFKPVTLLSKTMEAA